MAQGGGGQVDWLDDLVDSVRSLHSQIIQESGGVFGEHTSSLYAACARPFQTAFGEDIYSTPYSRAAAFFHAIICDHVFVDGNKRSATVGTIRMLAAEGAIDIDDVTSLRVRMLGDVALSTAADRLTVADVESWIRRIFDRDLLAVEKR